MIHYKTFMLYSGLILGLRALVSLAPNGFEMDFSLAFDCQSDPKVVSSPPILFLSSWQTLPCSLRASASAVMLISIIS